MTALSWRDGVLELRRLLVAEGGDPDRIQDTGLAWRAFRRFLAVPLAGLSDRRDTPDLDTDVDTLVIEFAGSAAPSLLLARRFAVPDLAATFQIELELSFAYDPVDEDDDDFWAAERTGEFGAEELAEAEAFLTGRGLVGPIHSRIALVNRD